MSTLTAAPDDEFLIVAEQAVRTSGASDALDALGWWDFLAELDDLDARTAVLAIFRAQGRATSSSAALGGLLAEPYRALVGADPGTVVAAIPRHSAHVASHVVVGATQGRNLLVDQPDGSVSMFAAADVQRRPIDVAGKLDLFDLDVTGATPLLTLAPTAVAAAREHSHRLGRVAIAAEILGAAEAIVGLAIEYAGQREQFGQPIGRFQAMRHTLSWAHTDCIAIDRVLRPAIEVDGEPSPMYSRVLKALAGRNGRRACERSLQVFGGIGFTAEHSHVHHHGRVLALDSLLGASSTLMQQLGTWVRTDAVGPAFTTDLLTRTAR